MLTLLLYVLIVGLVAALLFLVASAVFGRSEELGPLPEGTTATVLPIEGINGGDVRALRFQQVLRGYKAGEVDWALTRLAARIDELEWQLAQAHVAIGANHGNGNTATPHGEYANGTGHHYPTPYVPAGATGYAAYGQAAPPNHSAAHQSTAHQSTTGGHPASTPAPSQPYPPVAPAYSPAEPPVPGLSVPGTQPAGGATPGSQATPSGQAIPGSQAVPSGQAIPAIPGSQAIPSGQAIPAEWFAYGTQSAEASAPGQAVPATSTAPEAQSAPESGTAPVSPEATTPESAPERATVPGAAASQGATGVVPGISTPQAGPQATESGER